MMTKTVEVSGSWVVAFSYAEKKGARRSTIKTSMTVKTESAQEAAEHVKSRRGHLDGFQISGVTPETERVAMTDAEIVAAGRAQLAAMKNRA